MFTPNTLKRKKIRSKNKHKYGAKKTIYNGVEYPSKLEARTAYQIDLRIKAGEFLKVNRQYPVLMTPFDKLGNRRDDLTIKYVLDFKLHKVDGTFLLVESKGKETEMFRLKKKWITNYWLPNNPKYQYAIVRDKNGRLNWDYITVNQN